MSRTAAGQSGGASALVPLTKPLQVSFRRLTPRVKRLHDLLTNPLRIEYDAFLA